MKRAAEELPLLGHTPQSIMPGLSEGVLPGVQPRGRCGCRHDAAVQRRGVRDLFGHHEIPTDQGHEAQQLPGEPALQALTAQLKILVDVLVERHLRQT